MELDINHSIGQGVILHKRTRDTKNFFKYKAPYLCINLHQSNRVHPLISFNPFIIKSFLLLKILIILMTSSWGPSKASIAAY